MRSVMRPAVWIGIVATVLIPIIALAMPFAMPVRGPAPRDPHSRWTFDAPAREVAVTPAGKLFHDPGCPFIHGPRMMETASAALTAGLSPCPRCLPNPAPPAN